DKPRLTGNTLRVYVFVLKNGPSELREVQRQMGFSTASLASYHLGRLVKMGYVRQDDVGKYVATRDVSAEIMDGYTKIGANFVPQLFFLALLFSILVPYFSFRSLTSSAYTPFLVLSSIGILALLWFETIKLWRKMVTWQ
ncbi:MAG: hypothetical protein M1368_12160, partial [Thaumarchaeota archaeon]|nr:hypothetical protein [Nitrososphaerota archaeon]